MVYRKPTYKHNCKDYIEGEREKTNDAKVYIFLERSPSTLSARRACKRIYNIPIGIYTLVLAISCFTLLQQARLCIFIFYAPRDGSTACVYDLYVDFAHFSSFFFFLAVCWNACILCILHESLWMLDIRVKYMYLLTGINFSRYLH